MLLSLYTVSSLPPPHPVPITAVIFSGLGNCKSLTFQFSLPLQPTFHTAAKMNSYCQSTLPPLFNGLPLHLGQGRLLMTCPCYSIQLISCFWYNVLSSLTQTVCVLSWNFACQSPFHYSGLSLVTSQKPTPTTLPKASLHYAQLWCECACFGLVKYPQSSIHQFASLSWMSS